MGRGRRAPGREDPSAGARAGRRRGAARARARRRPYKGASLRAARLLHGRSRRRAVADRETGPLRRRRGRLRPRSARPARARIAAELPRARRGSCPGAWGLSLTAPCPSCTVAGRYGVRGRVLGPAARERPHFPCHPRRAPGQDPRRASSSEPLGSAIDVETVVAEKTNERHPKSAGGGGGEGGGGAGGGRGGGGRAARPFVGPVPAPPPAARGA